MRLLGVELTRLRWRRAVLVLVAACVLIPTFIFGMTAWSTRPVSSAELAEAQRSAAREAEQPYVQKDIERCIEEPATYFPPGEDLTDPAARCAEALKPKAEWFVSRQPMDVEELVRDIGTALPVLLCVLLLLVGSTFVGADWNSGSMSNQLLFEPRRTRVWGAKAAVLALLAATVAVVMQVAFWLATAALARSRDIGVPDETWDRLPGVVGRGTLLVVGGAVLGYSLTMLFRSTVATLGILFAVAVASSIVIAALPLGGENERWMLHTNVAAWLQHGTDYYNSSGIQVICEGFECSGMSRLSLWSGARYLGVILLLPAVAGLASFRRRDVP